MIEDIGRVVRVEGDEAYVEVERTSACAQCGIQEVEELVGGKPVFMALNSAKATKGETVKVRVQSVAYLKASAIIYGIPILFLIIGAVVGFYLAGKSGISSDTMSAMLGMAGVIVGIGVLFLFRRRGTRKEYIPIIVEVIGKDAVD
jgi:sigma-E factor negative regulatory protein RseC